jgi:Asp-tRNA(Asn)/Glu-tRNA(Gln) amidotransferase C subunit
MPDLETRLSEALREASEDRPRVADLADGARSRLRRRRRTTAAAVAAALVMVAVPVGLTLASRDASPDAVSVPDSWRTESFRDLTLRVPADWTYQGGRDWCLGSGLPAVTRTEGFLTNAACEPRFSYGVQFRDVPPEDFAEPKGVPDDAVLELVGTSGTSAWVVAESEEQLAGIVESVRQIDGVDPNGCPPVVDPEAKGVGERVSVCRYDSGELEQSELLSVEDSARAEEAVDAAPRDDGGYVACPEYSREQPVITMRSARLSADLLPSSGCALSNRFLDDTGGRLVTEDVLYWALSPGWQGGDSRLPMPEPLRTG